MGSRTIQRAGFRMRSKFIFDSFICFDCIQPWFTSSYMSKLVMLSMIIGVSMLGSSRQLTEVDPLLTNAWHVTSCTRISCIVSLYQILVLCYQTQSKSDLFTQRFASDHIHGGVLYSVGQGSHIHRCPGLHEYLLQTRRQFARFELAWWSNTVGTTIFR